MVIRPVEEHVQAVTTIQVVAEIVVTAGQIIVVAVIVALVEALTATRAAVAIVVMVDLITETIIAPAGPLIPIHDPAAP